MANRETKWDRLIEQQDQELTRDGIVSPFIHQQLQAYAEGQPISRVDVHSPAMERATARLMQSLKRSYVPCEDEDEE